jgi:RNA-directed DNA polymerase
VGETKSACKSFDVPKTLIWEAYLKVSSNKGVAGVDGQSLAEFEQDLQNNLFKLWNRMSSGSYFPGSVKAVPIPKNGGAQEF